MLKTILRLSSLAGLLLLTACCPGRWVKNDPRIPTPEPTVVVDDTVVINAGNNTPNAIGK